MTTDIDKDVRRVKEILKPLNRDELKELFEELGLSDATLRNKYSDSTMAYLDDLVRGWILRRDAVLDRGGATWESLKKVLQRLGHNGIAANIPSSTAGKLQTVHTYPSDITYTFNVTISLMSVQISFLLNSQIPKMVYFYIKLMYLHVIIFVFLDIHYLHNIMWLYYVGSVHKVKRTHKKKLATAAPPISSMLQCVMI